MHISFSIQPWPLSVLPSIRLQALASTLTVGAVHQSLTLQAISGQSAASLRAELAALHSQYIKFPLQCPINGN